MTTYEEEIAVTVQTHRQTIERDLAEARIRLSQAQAETAACEEQVGLLESLLAVQIDDGPGSTGPNLTATWGRRPLTLHEAMAEVLSTAPHRMLPAGEIARQINQRGLYRMRDGRPVEGGQIHARTGHYPHLFRKNGSSIELITKTANS